MAAIVFCALMWLGKIVLFWLAIVAVFVFLLSALSCCMRMLSAILAKLLP